MKHPFETLKSEYSQLLSLMAIRPNARDRVTAVAMQIMSHRSKFESVTKINCVPVIFIGPSFYREASLDFSRNPAQGWSLSSRSKIIPHNGPFPDWQSAAIEAYALNGLDRVGPTAWTWELICFYGEMFNGFGYRDYHKMHSPYLWGGTNIQTPGKYVEDKQFDATKMDEQLGIIPIAKRMVEIAPDLALHFAIPAPAASGLAVGTEKNYGTEWVQRSLHKLGFDVAIDGNYGRETRAAVHDFEVSYGLRVDGGYAGPEVIRALERALAELDKAAAAAEPAVEQKKEP